MGRYIEEEKRNAFLGGVKGRILDRVRYKCVLGYELHWYCFFDVLKS